VKGSPKHCRHRVPVLDAEARTVECEGCGKALDAFQVLLEYADGERRWQGWDQSVREKARELEELREEERKVKARTKNAARKEADMAVATERLRTEKMRQDAIQIARDIVAAGKRLERLNRRKGEA
jgi:hypothetical protein